MMMMMIIIINDLSHGLTPSPRITRLKLGASQEMLSSSFSYPSIPASTY